ncbi:Villin-1, partial [Manis pentadactyla]
TLALAGKIVFGLMTECKMLEQGYGEAWVTSMFQVKCEILTKGLGLALVGKCEIEVQDYGEWWVMPMFTVNGQVQESWLGFGKGDVWLTLMLKLKCRILAPGLRLELVRHYLSGKELGSWSDVTGVQDVGTGLWARAGVSSLWKDLGSGSDMKECKMVDQGYGECEVESQKEGVIVDINGEGGNLWSMDRDYGEACLMPVVGAERTGDVNADAECPGKFEIVVQITCEACLMPVVTLKGQETLALRKELGSWSDVTGSARCWNRVM